MPKKILIGLGCIFTFIATVVIGINVYSGYKTAQYNKTAIPYIDAAITEISKWDEDVFYNHLASEAKKDVKQEDVTKTMRLFSKMGALVSHEEPEFAQIWSYVAEDGKSRSVITYDVDAKYENGDALLTFTLMGKSENLELLELLFFNLQSNALVE
jgi:hypothetical protein